MNIDGFIAREGWTKWEENYDNLGESLEDIANALLDSGYAELVAKAQYVLDNVV